MNRLLLIAVAAEVAFQPCVAVVAAVPAPTGKRMEQLKPGESFWAPQVAPAGPVIVIVSLAAQRAYVYRNGIPIGVTTVSTGKPGHETPTGVFTILQKAKDHKSNLYSSAPMPFMQRLTWDGIALHAGNLPGYPASHGCVRLPLAFARALFGVTQLGLTVVITDQPNVPEIAPTGPLLAPLEDRHASPTAYHWRPERAPNGPISVLISAKDKRIIVLRDGVEIGSSEVRIDEPVDQTSAYTLGSIDEAGVHWLRLALPGQPFTDGEVSEAERGRVHLPEGFRSRLAEALQPGATLLVLRESIASSGTGAKLRVLESDDSR
ncbi:L,D-transpeptidase [Sphingomonas jatrophae]|uniref:L,D-transpeptidase catalytic domain n=1 Tax=Sphingomonas jatrophae TaxID=1166337 RepID=A0A1I6M9I8_9SPHN|nr:L,D-transpeptidase [Sphingomonas jatrophae]SFS12359.1 L,D-transpeptidase catalytic domain [Sphingomonas jatrophae]